MPNVSQMIAAIISREGGFVNDPSDPGGATKYGITIATLSAARGRRASVSDVKALTKNEAARIYEHRYYRAPLISALPELIQPPVFDMYVNAGTRAVKILQATLNKFGAQLSQDGMIGPNTIHVSQMLEKQAGRYLVDAYGIERREFYYGLADARPASRKYACTKTGKKGGWILRSEEFMSAKYRYTDAQHRARIAKWG